MRDRLGTADPSRDDGLTADEGVVMDALIAAVEQFGRCPRQHPDEMRDFVDGIHRCQDALALRVARRAFPAGWPVKVTDPADGAKDGDDV